MRVTTETGSVYEFDGDKVRRVNTGRGMRMDGEWLKFRHLHPVEVGRSMAMMLEPLGEGDATFRVTSPVAEVS